ncbi:hypothetical protein DM01DRAFT_1379694 [Hesseltinella vesiculosa]|uniref:Ribosomal protein S36, mitochondrial n=1 Tax=Hesseltinella vesiculosa TaxID=101127 RepID=A0A1X2GYT1_9FUNG|nr:hypothetical protein DM01DRAFT_1379694 [Hesseltinella vesiculosa]
MQPTTTMRAVHTPLIRFVGSRQALWKSQPPHTGPHPLTPSNLEKHVPKPEPVLAAPAITPASSTTAAGAIEMSQLPARYHRVPLTQAEMEAIELGGADLTY